ncbi:MAG: hypothetical protein IJX51_00125 [Clostridia bacterium]|nr:hypothetical protein [Clostridia bacterium]
MLKNKYIKLASILLILCLITSCVISGTLAKYTTGGTATDSARVAKWGVNISVVGDNAFKTAYGTTVVSSDTDNVVAPGTKGTLAAVTVSGQPEVKVNYAVNVDLELTDRWSVGAGKDYCPIVFTVKSGSTVVATVYMKSVGENQNSALELELEKAIIYALTGKNTATADGTGSQHSVERNAGTSLSADITVEWEWHYDGESVGLPAGAVNTDEYDTYIGSLPTAPNISFSLEISVTQIV